MLAGLRRLIANRYHFTISQRAKDNIISAVRDANNILDFLDSEGYVAFKADYEASTKICMQPISGGVRTTQKTHYPQRASQTSLARMLNATIWSRSAIYTSAAENGAGDIWVFIFCSRLWSCNETSKPSVRAFMRS